MTTDINLNTILYGPPGTGKTYNTVNYAVAICEGKPIADVRKEPYQDVKARYDELRRAGRVVPTTFHQAYGYEEFIGGIRPVLEKEKVDGQNTLSYRLQDGIFKQLCDEARQSDLIIDHKALIWKVRLKENQPNELKEECFKDGCIRFDGPKEVPAEKDKGFGLIQ